MHHQLSQFDSIDYYDSPSAQAELGLVLELISTTLPLSQADKHVLAIELPQVSM